MAMFNYFKIMKIIFRKLEVSIRVSFRLGRLKATTICLRVEKISYSRTGNELNIYLYLFDGNLLAASGK